MIPAAAGSDDYAVARRATARFVMAGKITAIEPQKRNKERVNVYLDGQFAFGLAAVEAARLRPGQYLTDEEIARLQERDAVEQALQAAMNLLSYRPRSRAELQQRLAQKGYPAQAVEEALGRLERSGLVDDGAFARYWVENRAQGSPRGQLLLKGELAQKGIDRQLIDQALAGYDEEAAAARVAEKIARRLQGPDLATARRRLVDALKRRGFAYDVIEPLVARMLEEYDVEE